MIYIQKERPDRAARALAIAHDSNPNPDYKSPAELVEELTHSSHQQPDVAEIRADIVSLKIILAHVFAERLDQAAQRGASAGQLLADTQAACLGAVSRMQFDGPSQDATRALIAERVAGFFGRLSMMRK